MNLADRMKQHEHAQDVRLTRRVPVILRLDGKAFHTWTRGLERPWSQAFHSCMWVTAVALCEQVQGARLAYVQSDEISLLLTDWKTPTTQAWYDYRVQKMVSVAAGMAATAFNDIARSVLRRDGAVFDGRAFSLPRDEVANYFVWRQQDATRNSIQSLGQACFSHRELHGKSCSDIQDMLHEQHGINWNDCPTAQKRGVCIVREEYEVVEPSPHTRSRWVPDTEIPVFTQDRGYIERYLYGGD